MFNFKSVISQKVLNYFFNNDKETKYNQELAQILDLDISNLNKKLRQLSAEGVLLARSQGREIYYSLNKDFPLLKELKKLFSSQYGLEIKIKNSLDEIKGIEQVIIFGSYAQGKMSKESDIDILVIGDHDSLAVKRALLPLQKEIQREINIIDMSPAEFAKLKKNKDEFVMNVVAKKQIKVI